MRPVPREKRILDFLRRVDWIDDPSVEFLAAGEYNENYIIRSHQEKLYVFRVNHGSQLGLQRQIEYEFMVLEAVKNSGVTPKPLFYETDPPEIDGGVLLMEYIPGIPLEYSVDRDKAVRVFSLIHNLPLDKRLIIQENPVLDIAEESRSLLTRYKDHPLGVLKKILLEYCAKINLLGEQMSASFNNEPLCIVNTEVNSGNFIINNDRAYLVDWEKAVISFRYQDLGHFIVPTTTLWKTDYMFSEEEKMKFLTAYAKDSVLNIPIEELREKTRILEKTITLRGLAWCFMAFFEYTRTDRIIKNEETFKKIKQYLDGAEYLIGLVDSN